MELNIKILLLAALVPLIIGFIWYNPKAFGTVWMKTSGVTPETMKGANMALIFGLTFIFSFLAAFALQFVVIHQYHLYSILMKEPGLNEPGSELNNFVKGFMEKYGNNYRTFKHGALHGTIAGFTLALPVIGVNSLFERKGFKYIAINAGFWIVCFAIMGGIICAWN